MRNGGSIYKLYPSWEGDISSSCNMGTGDLPET